MKNLISLTLLSLAFLLNSAMASLFDQNISDLRGRELKLSQYNGKVILVVNIATRCGYTPQLDDLEKLYQKYKEKGLVVLGVPSNDFGSQTPEEGENIEKFCRLNYGVTFPITAKTEVSGREISPFLKYVLSQFDNKAIQWNFEKFLFDKNGKPIARYSSDQKPLSSSIEKSIQKAIAQK